MHGNMNVSLAYFLHGLDPQSSVTERHAFVFDLAKHSILSER